MRAALSLLLALSASAASAQTYFQGAGAVSTPTAETMRQGVCAFGLTGRYDSAASFEREEAGVAFEAAAFPWMQIGAVWDEGEELHWTGRLRLIQESGAVPAVAVGAAFIGAEHEPAEAHAVLTKELNLPSAGFFQCSVGVRHRLSAEEGQDRTRPFGSFEKKWFAFNSDLRALAEWEGDEFLIGMERRYEEGLRIGAAYQFSGKAVVFSLRYSSDKAVQGVQDAKDLAKRAAKIRD
ncbi:MAG: hypothetical protein OXT69_09570 [Candidatus Poribacteria bacterium]|nr:hypothetical protein [Candidatus Poribacteria bacterium]